MSVIASFVRRLVGPVGVSLALIACQDRPTHPPYAETCPGEGVCRPTALGSRPRPANSGGGKPPPDIPPEGPDIVTGSVRELVDDLFSSSIDFQGRAEIFAEGLQTASVSATYTGANTFVLRDFLPEDPLWLLVNPEENLGVLPTLSPLPLEAAFDPVELGVVRQDNVDLVFQRASVISERLIGYAQVILVFTDATRGIGVPGVEVALPGAEFVSYANGGAWSDIETETDQTGVVMLANVWAQPFPGGNARVHLSGAAQGKLDVRVVRDTVTLAEVPLE